MKVLPWEAFRRILSVMRLSCLAGTVVFLMQGCSAPRNPASDQINSAVQKIREENGESDRSTKSRVELYKKLGWEKLPDQGQSSELPADLTGTSFYGENGGQIDFESPDSISVKVPDTTAQKGSYQLSTSQGSSSLQLQYRLGDKLVEPVYLVLRNGRKVTLNQQGAAETGLDPVIRGTLPP